MIQFVTKKTTIVTIVIYTVLYVFINHRGPLIDNDTIEYIGFAQTLADGKFPFSPYYQPGLGFLIYLFKTLFFTDYLTAFRIVNFMAGLGLVLTLQILWVWAFGDKSIISVLLASLPAVVYLSSLLYADIVFVFLAFMAIFFINKACKDKFSFSMLFASSVFTALAIFTKYNALVVLVLGIVFLILNYLLNRHVFLLLLKQLAVFCFLPVSYIVFWKFFNGNLAMVEFNRWIEPVTMDCIMRYLKINWISSYHLLLDRGVLGLELYVNHILLMMIGFVVFFVLVKKANIKLVNSINYIKKNRSFLAVMLFVILYTVAVNTMESLNCRKEPSVRLYSICFIGLGFLITGSMYRLLSVFNKPVLITSSIMLIACYNAAVLGRIYGDTEGIIIDTRNKPYIETVNYLKTQKKSGQVAGLATPKINRYWFALGGDFQAMGIFPYQHHHEMDHNYIYDDSTYQAMVNGKLDELNPGQFLVLELEPNFMNKQLQRMNFTERVFHSGSLVVFRKQ